MNTNTSVENGLSTNPSSTMGTPVNATGTGTQPAGSMNPITMLRNMDPDDLFSYSTVKYVTIRDRRLGIPYYLFVIVIFLYIVGWEIIYKQGYIDKQAITGNIRLTLKEPDQFFPPSQLPYCNNPYPCHYLSQYDVLYPALEPNTMFLSTRIKEQYFVQKPNCNPPTSPECAQLQETSNRTTYLVAGIEDYTIGIEHTVGSQDDDSVTAIHSDMDGELKNQNGDTIKKFPHSSTKSYDIISVREILDAAGITLEDHSISPLADITNETLRIGGTVILVFIHYSNNHLHPNHFKYYYRIHYVPKAEFKVEEPRYYNTLNVDGTQSNSMTVLDRHGIRILFVPSGNGIGRFSFIQLLITLVAGLALLSIAKLLVDFVVLKLLPQRKLYKESKYEVTDDFSDVRDNQRQEQKRQKKLIKMKKHPQHHHDANVMVPPS